MRLWLSTWSLLCVTAMVCLPASAQSTLPPSLITTDTIIIFHVELEKLKAERLVGELQQVLPQSPQLDRYYVAFREAFENLRAAGVEKAYVLIEAQDLSTGSVTVAIPEAGTKQEVRAVIDGLWPMSNSRAVNGTLVVEGRQPARRSPPAADERLRQWSQALENAPPAAIQLVVVPSADQRRVLREMPVYLPSRRQQVSLSELSRLQWFVLSINTDADVQLEILAETGDAQAAAALQQQIQQALVALPNDPLVKEKLPMLAGMIEAMIPRVDGSRLTLAQNQAWKSWRVLLSAALSSAKRQAQSAECVTHLKMLALAMHNFHDTYNSFPPHASYDEQGRPLLSWRVFLLPYLDEMELYNQFHLDEPWDSEHNRKLIEKMPDVFSCEHPELAQKGMTTFLAPHGEGTVFSGREGVAIKDIKDGSSGTALIFAVAPEHAVTWTKPSDLEVDMENPGKGLAGPDQDRFYVSLADGAVLTLPSDIDPKKLRAFLLRSDGEAGTP